MPNWKSYESSVRLLSAIVAAHPELKLKYDAIGGGSGDGEATPRKTPAKKAPGSGRAGKKAKQVSEERDDNEDDDEPATDTPSKKSIINKVQSGRIQKATPKRAAAARKQNYAESDDKVESGGDEDMIIKNEHGMGAGNGHSSGRNGNGISEGHSHENGYVNAGNGYGSNDYGISGSYDEDEEVYEA